MQAETILPKTEKKKNTALEMLERIPKAGIRNFWYPAAQSKKLKSKPMAILLLGERLVLLRDPKSGAVAALEDRCPHKGTVLSYGRSYFPGTISCPYHGWTFDRRGECVAVLSEGPDSKVPGTVRIRSYPTREYRGVIFVFVGEVEPPPLEEDVPAEFFDASYIFETEVATWEHNWEQGQENNLDTSHAQVLHRHSFFYFFAKLPAWVRVGARVMKDGKGVGTYYEEAGPFECEYPNLGHYSNNRFWKVGGPLGGKGRYKAVPDKANPDKERFANATRLPCWRVADLGGMLFMAAAVPVDGERTAHWAFLFKRASGFAALRFRLYHHMWLSWAMCRLFIGEDRRILERMEKEPKDQYLYLNDVGIIAWRKLVLRAQAERASRPLRGVGEGSTHAQLEGLPQAQLTERQLEAV